MRTTVRLGRWFGIDVGAHWSVLVIAGLLSFGLTQGVGDLALWVTVIPTVVAFLGCLLAHELAHSVIARRNNMQVRGITLWMLGGVAQLESPMPSAGAQFRIAAAGPAMSYLLAGAFFMVSRLAGALGLDPLPLSALSWLAFVNVVLGTFNLIPAAPLDGGRILSSAVWAATKDRTRADIVATSAGQVFGGAAVVLGLIGPFVGVPYVSLWTAMMGLFVVRTARAEQHQARLMAAIAARDARVASEVF